MLPTHFLNTFETKENFPWRWFQNFEENGATVFISVRLGKGGYSIRKNYNLQGCDNALGCV